MDDLPDMHKRAARKTAERKASGRRPPLTIRGKPAPRALSDGIILAGSIAATLQGAHKQCQRRECRTQQRCCSALGASKDLCCDVDLPEDATVKLMAGMLLFAHMLAEGRK